MNLPENWYSEAINTCILIFLTHFPVGITLLIMVILEAAHVYVYVFSRRFYPKRLTNEDITSYKKLTIDYIVGTHESDSVRGDRVE